MNELPEVKMAGECISNCSSEVARMHKNTHARMYGCMDR